MSSRTFIRHSAARALAVAVAAWACAGAAVAADFAGTVLATGLNNPRGLSFGPDGALYIAEAGLPGGPGPSTLVRGAAQVYTETGSVTRWQSGVQTRILVGLPSLYDASDNAVGGGPNGIAFSASGALQIAIGAGIDPNVRATDLGPGGIGLGRVITPGGASIDVAGYEATFNPAGGPLDSNPWHLTPVAGSTLVTDAGGNSVLRIAADGAISTVATFASRALGGPFPTDPVPTGIAVGPDGSIYVGELTGFPFVPGASRIHRIAPGGSSEVFATGFTQVTDLAFAPDGNLYVLEFDSNGLLNPGDGGALWRLASDGSRSLVFSDGLVQPTGLEIDADGSFYVSNFGNSAGQGQLLHIAAAVPEPETYGLLLAGLAAIGLRRRAKMPRGRPSRGNRIFLLN